MSKMTGGQAIVKSLIKNGVDTVFALPGGQLDFLFDALYKEGDRIQVIHTRHEQASAYMAYGYAKSTGRVGACAVVPGPGLLNAAGALCTAWSNYAPVLCVSGQIPSTSIGKGYGDLHEINDQLGMISHITKWSSSIDHPAEAPVKIAEAFKQMATGCPRPVEIEMPMDIMALEAEVHLLDAQNSYPKLPVDQDQIDKALDLLQKAKKPIIVAGSGAVQAYRQVRELAEALQIPVMACRSGKGIVSSDSYLSATFPMGHRLWADADVVLAIGTRLNWPLTMWGRDDGLKVIRIDIDPTQISRICQPELGIVADALDALDALLAANGAFKAASRQAELSELKQSVDAQIRKKVGPQMQYLDIIPPVA